MYKAHEESPLWVTNNREQKMQSVHLNSALTLHHPKGILNEILEQKPFGTIQLLLHRKWSWAAEPLKAKLSSQSLGGVLGRVWGGLCCLGFLFLNKRNLTLQHSSAADQKSSCLEQLLSSSPLHIAPFEQSTFKIRFWWKKKLFWFGFETQQPPLTPLGWRC